jgi:hypothetical protein
MLPAPQPIKPFDIIIHLPERERMPIYFGMLHFQATKRTFVTTHEYADGAKILSKLLPSGCSSTIELIINSPYAKARF